MNSSNKLLSDIVAFRTYANFLRHLSRRESLSESINRNMTMHLDRFPKLSRDIIKSYQRVHELKVMPSMRALQFSGSAILKNEIRQYNCSFLHIDNIRAFGETFFLLLSGTGVGYSVQNRHISQLPKLKSPKQEGFFLVQDSIMGWAQALDLLIEAYFLGRVKPQFDYGNISPKGTYLTTIGAKAPGPEPLKKMLELVEQKLKIAIGRKLTDLEVHDIVCIISEAVLAGGIRRAALIVLFDRTSKAMLTCKQGEWWNKAPWRARANNSVVLPRNEVTKDEFDEIFKMCQESKAGEPGFFWTDDVDLGTNPCCFTGETLIAVGDGRNSVSIKQLSEESNGKYKFPVYSAKRLNYKNQYGETDKFDKWSTEIKNAVAYKSGTKSIVKVLLSNGDSFECTNNHRLATSSGDWVEAIDSIGIELKKFFSSNEKYRTINSVHNGYSRQYKLIWEFYNGKTPEGYVIDHIDETRHNDSINNLQILETHVHDKKSADSHRNNNNQFYKSAYKSINMYTAKKVIESLHSKNIDVNELTYTEESNDLYPGKKTNYGTIVGKAPSFDKLLSNLTELGITNFGDFTKLETKNFDHLTNSVFVIDVIDENKVVDVYDLTVEGNSNFYIITKSFDERSMESRGVLVHNCEISLNPFQFCNLTTINQTGIENEKDFLNRVYAATMIGTLQASYTDFDYVRPKWKETTEKEALIGVSFTGIADSAGIVTNDLLNKGAKLALEVNEKYAKKLGINIAARTTTVKPEGSSSCVLGSSSGIHARHSQHYLRRIRMNKEDALAVYLKSVIPDLVEDDTFSSTDIVVTIPQESPDGAIIRTKETAFTLMNRVLDYRKNWITPGHRSGDNKHNVSVTISVKEEEWEELRELMWKNRDHYSGIALLPYEDHTYKQAPFEECTKEKYEELSKLVKDIDLRMIKEEGDNTTRIEQPACAGGICEIL